VVIVRKPVDVWVGVVVEVADVVMVCEVADVDEDVIVETVSAVNV